MVNMTFLPNLQNMAPVSYCIYTEFVFNNVYVQIERNNSCPKECNCMF